MASLQYACCVPQVALEQWIGSSIVLRHHTPFSNYFFMQFASAAKRMHGTALINTVGEHIAIYDAASSGSTLDLQIL